MRWLVRKAAAWFAEAMAEFAHQRLAERWRRACLERQEAERTRSAPTRDASGRWLS